MSLEELRFRLRMARSMKGCPGGGYIVSGTTYERMKRAIEHYESLGIEIEEFPPFRG